MPRITWKNGKWIPLSDSEDPPGDPPTGKPDNKWQVGSIQYKILNLIPWEYGRQAIPNWKELASIWDNLCELIPDRKHRQEAFKEFAGKLAFDSFNNTSYRQAVVTRTANKLGIDLPKAPAKKT